MLMCYHFYFSVEIILPLLTFDELSIEDAYICRNGMKISRGIILGITTVILYIYFRLSPRSVEFLYGQLFYPLYQYIRFIVFKFISFPILYILLGYLVLWGIFKIIITPKFKEWRWISSLRMTFSILGFIVFFFYILWGFNYQRPTMLQRLDVELENPDSMYIATTMERVIDSLNSIRSQLDIDSVDICDIEVSSEIDSSGLEVLKGYLSFLGYPTSYEGVVRELRPSGLLLRWSTAGFFMPYVGEAYIDPGLPNIQKPYVRMHELCHVYGITQEGEANFLAYQACRRSADPIVRYSGYLAIYPYIASAAHTMDKGYYTTMYARLDSGVKEDFDRISECHELYPSFMPKVRDFLYDTYLTSQGVEGGIKNYSRIIQLDYIWQKMSRENGFVRGIR